MASLRVGGLKVVVAIRINKSVPLSEKTKSPDLSIKIYSAFLCVAISVSLGVVAVITS